MSLATIDSSAALSQTFATPPPAARPAPRLMPIEEMRSFAKAMAEARGLGVKSEAHGLAVMMRAEADGVHYVRILERYDYVERLDRLVPKSSYILARFIESGGRIKWTRTDTEGAEAIFSAPGLEEPYRAAFTIEDARRAKLIGKDNWAAYPEDMCVARVITRGVRRTMSAVLTGYSAEEIADMDAIGTFTPAQPQETPSGIPLPPAKPLKPEAPPNISRPTLAQMVAEAIKTSKLPVEKPTLFKELKTEVVRRGLREVGAVITGDDLVKLWDDEANAEWMRAAVARYIDAINVPAAQGD